MINKIFYTIIFTSYFIIIKTGEQDNKYEAASMNFIQSGRINFGSCDTVKERILKNYTTYSNDKEFIKLILGLKPNYNNEDWAKNNTRIQVEQKTYRGEDGKQYLNQFNYGPLDVQISDKHQDLTSLLNQKLSGESCDYTEELLQQIIFDNDAASNAEMYAICLAINQSIKNQTIWQYICNCAKMCNKNYQYCAEILLQSTNESSCFEFKNHNNKKSLYTRYRKEEESFSNACEIVFQGKIQDPWFQAIKRSIEQSNNGDFTITVNKEEEKDLNHARELIESIRKKDYLKSKEIQEKLSKTPSKKEMFYIDALLSCELINQIEKNILKLLDKENKEIRMTIEDFKVFNEESINNAIQQEKIKSTEVKQKEKKEEIKLTKTEKQQRLYFFINALIGWLRFLKKRRKEITNT
jgi:hypothetical protein